MKVAAAMEGFDPSSMPYMNDPLSLGNIGAGDYRSVLPALGIQEQTGLFSPGDFSMRVTVLRCCVHI